MTALLFSLVVRNNVLREKAGELACG